ncbi:MAG: hypothetical protein ACJAZN_002286, partial [Planctomycetota bacterium]
MFGYQAVISTALVTLRYPLVEGFLLAGPLLLAEATLAEFSAHHPPGSMNGRAVWCHPSDLSDESHLELHGCRREIPIKLAS